ncbi:MAG: helix-turn-helix domain-containing protein [Clostridiales bacterium]|nr:helix-turn-helix domain-containing protein [Clostridiales bacterium]
MRRQVTDKEIAYIRKNKHRKLVDIARELNRHPSTVAKIIYRDEAEQHRTKPRRFAGCDKDCYNCPYEDCLAPVSVAEKDLHTDYWIKMKDGVRMEDENE